ncbi:MAG: extracellular solute-binding protein, partial [Bellilinea sp.]
MTKKYLPLISILLIAAFALAACKPAATATPEPVVEPTAAAGEPTAAPAEPTAEPAAEPVEVTFWHAYGTGSAEEVTLTKLLAQAAVDLPDVKINVLQVPFNDIYNKYRTDVAAGSGPDMFIAPNDSLGDDARAELIADITDLLAGKLDGVNQLGIDGMTVDGKIYGVPESMKA